MKKNYMKPMLAIELFSFAQSVSRDCSGSIPKEQLNFNEPGTCVWDLGGTYVFTDNSACHINGENMGVGCYNNPSEGQYVFRS